ncbi:odorant receptor 65a-like [Drosophila tropicalis]|uniref:odorant receptor 65a-like n=1 Tax=Drosophila tropicalis TaxID=46794 RepID=UPI0035AB75A2
MAVPSRDGILVRLLEQYNVGWRLYKNLEQIPRHMTPYYSREQMKIMGNYANAEERLLTRRRVWHAFLLVKLTTFIVPTIIGLTESLDSIVEFSEDALWTISGLYVIARWSFYYLKADQVDEIVDALEECHHQWNVGPNSEETQSRRRCIVDRVNDVFYNPLLTFLLANFILLLLCTFAALAARHQPLVAGRFVMTMPIVFGGLIYWSKCGDLVTQTSQDVAVAAFEAYDCPLWITRSSTIQRDLMFLIQRAQKPLNIGARSPLPAFNLVTCMAVSCTTPKGRHQQQQQQQQQQHKHKQSQT